MSQDQTSTPSVDARAQGHSTDRAWDIRMAAARGESTPISIRGWIRIITRSMLMAALIVVFVTVVQDSWLLYYGSPFPMWL